MKKLTIKELNAISIDMAIEYIQSKGYLVDSRGRYAGGVFGVGNYSTSKKIRKRRKGDYYIPKHQHKFDYSHVIENLKGWYNNYKILKPDFIIASPICEDEPFFEEGKFFEERTFTCILIEGDMHVYVCTKKRATRYNKAYPKIDLAFVKQKLNLSK